MILKEFLVKLGFQVNEASLTKFYSATTSASAKVALLGSAVTAAAGVVFAGVNKMAEELDKVGDVAARIDLTADSIFRLGFAASQNDSDIETVTASLEGLAKTAGLAANGLGRGREVFQKLGINVKDSNGKLKNTAELMSEVGAAIKPLEKGEQLALLERLGIDRSLVGTLTSDLSALSAEYDRINRAAGFVPEEATKDAGKFVDALAKLKFVLGTLAKSVASKFFARFTAGFKEFQEILIRNMPNIISVINGFIGFILSAFSVVFGVFSAAVNVFGPVISKIIEWVSTLWAKMGFLEKGILLVVAAWKFLNLSFLASPLGLIIGLVVALVLAIDDLMTAMEGGESLFDWSIWLPSINGVVDAVTSFAALLKSSFELIFGLFGTLIKFFTDDFSVAWESLKINFGSFIDIVKNLWGVLKGVGEALGGFFGAATAIRGGQSVLIPSPSTAAQVAGGATQSVNQNTVVNVTGATDPKGTASAIAGAQAGVNANLTRNLKGAAR
jgi:hypothetical protein